MAHLNAQAIGFVWKKGCKMMVLFRVFEGALVDGAGLNTKVSAAYAEYQSKR